MAAQNGINVVIKYDADGHGTGSAAVAIAGGRTDGFRINNTPIDITDKGDSGLQTLLDDIAMQELQFTVEGLLVDTTLASLAHASTASAALHDFIIDVGSLFTIQGSFFIQDFEVSAPYNDATTFTATLIRSGASTFASG